MALKLEESPFYAEGGGQVADAGWIHTDSGKLDVVDVVRFENDQVIVGRLAEGSVVEGERAKAMVNAVRRHQTACNHTATHLLHNALRIVLGDDVRQAGSLVHPDRLRFDYKTRRAPTAAELRQIEDLVNRRIVENHPVRPFVTTREYAAEIGALAFFEEKYGEFVRVLEIDDFSRELCGGTHVSSTSQIGLLQDHRQHRRWAPTRGASRPSPRPRRSSTIARSKRARRPLADELRRGARPRRRRPSSRWLDELGELHDKPCAPPESGERRDARRRAGRRGRSTWPAPRWWPASPQVDAARRAAGAGRRGARGACPTPSSLLLAAASTAASRPWWPSATPPWAAALHAQDVLRAMMPAVDGKGGGKPTLARGGGTDVERHRGGALEAGVRQGAGAARRLRCGCWRSTTASRAPGVAVSDETGTHRTSADASSARDGAAGRARVRRALVAAEGAGLVVVGLPVSLDGGEHAQASEVRALRGAPHDRPSTCRCGSTTNASRPSSPTAAAVVPRSTPGRRRRCSRTT